MNLQGLNTWWRSRPLREKLLVVGGGLAAVLALGDALLTAPLEHRLRQQQAQLASLQEQLNADPSGRQAAASQRQQEAELRQRLQAAQARATQLRQQLGDAAALPDTLRALTATVGSLQLLALDLGATADVQPATNGPAAPLAASPTAGGLPRLYRLPVTLKVSGSYAELHTLLKQFEQHAQGLHWTQLQLDASRWPAIELTLQAHVLSTAPRWGAPA